MDVICCGMYRACSTWQYEVVGHLIEWRRKGLRLGLRRGARLRPWPRPGRFRVLKCHDKHPNFSRAIDRRRRVAVYSYRDLRDVVDSMRHKAGRPFEALMGEGLVHRILENDRYWMSRPGVLVQRDRGPGGSTRSAGSGSWPRFLGIAISEEGSRGDRRGVLPGVEPAPDRATPSGSWPITARIRTTRRRRCGTTRRRCCTATTCGRAGSAAGGRRCGPEQPGGARPRSAATGWSRRGLRGGPVVGPGGRAGEDRPGPWPGRGGTPGSISPRGGTRGSPRSPEAALGFDRPASPAFGPYFRRRPRPDRRSEGGLRGMVAMAESREPMTEKRWLKTKECGSWGRIRARG